MARLLFTSRSFGSLDNPGSSAAASKLLNLVGNPVLYMKQTHGNKIIVVTNQDASDNLIYEADGLVTDKVNVSLAVQVADCLPLLLTSKNVVAAVHVGREGLLNGVALNAVEAMRELGANQIEGVVGPFICAECYEVGTEMYMQVTQMMPATGGKINYLNLFAGLQDQLRSIKLISLGICTKANNGYFSHRAFAEPGRQVGLVSL